MQQIIVFILITVSVCCGIYYLQRQLRPLRKKAVRDGCTSCSGCSLKKQCKKK